MNKYARRTGDRADTFREIRSWLARYAHLDRIMNNIARDLDRLEQRGIDHEWVAKERKRLVRLTAMKISINKALLNVVPGSVMNEALRLRYLGRGPDDPMPTWKRIGYKLGYNYMTLQQYERNFVAMIADYMEESLDKLA